MKINTKRGLILITAWIWISLGGCGAKVTTTLIQKDSLFEVYLQKTIGKDSIPIDAGYQHPISLSPEEIQRLLKSVQVRQPGGILQQVFSGSHREIEPAFSDEEVQHMASGMSKALASATTADRINWGLKHSRGLFTPSITTGVVYVKDDRFAVILGNYQYIPIPDSRDMYHQFPDPLDTQGSQTATIVPGPFQELFKSERSRWKNRWLLIDYRALLSSSPEQEAQMPENPSGLEEKLNTLKRLRDQGLITEEDYQEKKKEMLKEL
jgi:hypothetical protein